jgi:arsenate reductase
MNMKKKVLFVCVYNDASSQIAEAFLNHIYGDVFEAYSAGLGPGRLDLCAAETMWEAGLDISANNTKWLFDFIKIGRTFDYVITVCDESNAGRCPNFPGATRLHWSFPNLSKLQGTDEEKLVKMREGRDAIKEKIQHWGAEVSCLKIRSM